MTAPADDTTQADATTEAQDTTTSADTQDTTTSPPDLIVLQRELDRARRDAIKFRTEARKLQEAADKAAEGEKTELQKALDEAARYKAENETLASQFRARDLQLAAQTEAIRLGFRRPERAVREIDVADVEYDDDGQPTNIGKLLKAELEARPELKADRPVPPDAGAGNRGKTTLSMEQIIAKGPEWIAEHEAEADEAYADYAAGR